MPNMVKVWNCIRVLPRQGRGSAKVWDTHQCRERGWGHAWRREGWGNQFYCIFRLFLIIISVVMSTHVRLPRHAPTWALTQYTEEKQWSLTQSLQKVWFVKFTPSFTRSSYATLLGWVQRTVKVTSLDSTILDRVPVQWVPTKKA